MLADIAQRALGGRLRRAEELVDGSFNAAYRLVADNGRCGIVKAAPTDPATLLRHEHGIMRTEAMFYQRAAHVVPVPQLLYTDFDRRYYDTDILVMSEIPGRAWDPQGQDAAASPGVRRQLGQLVAQLHTVTGTTFGYPETSVGLWADTWPDAFGLMTEAILRDADDHGVPLPASVLDTVEAHRDELAEVTTPALVHFDLWPGNIFVSDGSVTGLIDAERALWADPLAEFVSLTLFRDLDDEPDLMEGYLAGGGSAPDDGPSSIRMTLYRMYLDLLMIAEAAPRGYVQPERERFVRADLDAQLARL
jgi:aminoglycoside phosphotransferase (APT) family kinase protein